MNAVYARGPGDSHDWYGDQRTRRQHAIEQEYERERNDRKGDLFWLESAACDALTQASIDDIKTLSSTEAIDKATAYKHRATILSLISSGADDAELGRLMRIATNNAFNRECWNAATRYVDHMSSCGVRP